MKKKNNSAKSTTRKKKPPKSRYRETKAYQELHILRKVPTKKEYIELVARDLIEWSTNNDEARTINKFYRLRGIPLVTVDAWKKRNSFFAGAVQYAKMAIGSRREDEGLIRNMDPGFVFKSMSIYDKDYRDLKEWESKLKEKEASAGQPLTTYINKMETAQLKERAKKLKQKD